ncbi:Nucleolar Complex 2 protein [Rhizophlyctis rosea]|uniref:Nucleolar Complex 2 protein n=1 Tax=Rhizophlyctis rosea TaxID=64517 RepID=A0AAD5S8W8_9FUNG|nr:Nucleolar Complex 2 protein [Rhizophlyctis rosea]
MGKAKKSTKKFVKNHLKDVLTRRKKTQAANKWRKKLPAGKAAPVDTVDEAPEQNLSDDSDIGFDDAGLEGLEDDAFDSDASEMSEDELENLEGFDGSDSDDGNGELELDFEASGDEEEEEEAAEEGDEMSQLAKEISDHKKQLDSLKERDPEFYKYLEENNQELLNFSESEDEGGEGDEDVEMEDGEEEGEEGEEGEGVDDEEGEGGEEEEDFDEEGDDATEVTKEMVTRWKNATLKNHSIRSLRKMLLAFRAAAAVGDSSDEGHYSYKVEDSAVFNRLLLNTLRAAPVVFDHHLYGDKPRKGLPSGNSKWKRLQPLVKSFLMNLLRFLKQMTDVSVLTFVLQESEASAPYFACFPKLGKDYLRQLLKFWTSADEQVRIVSFLCLRKLAVSAPSPYLEMTLKGSYLAFANQSRSTNLHTWTHITFMMNCIVELCGLHIPTTYQHAFSYIRQLAVNLRNAIITKTKESFKAVYNWQFVHSIRLWTQVLCVYCERGSGLEATGGSGLKPLIYPLVQVTIGAMRLKPSSKFFPLRFHLVRSLIAISRKTGTFIPVASHLFETFESAELRGKAKPSTQKPLDFMLNIKTANSYLGTRTYQNGVVEEVVNLLFDYYGAFALSIAFPELAIPAILQLKRYAKKSKNFHMNKQIQQLVEKLEQNSRFIEQKRSQVDFSPKDEQKVAEFLSNIDPNQSPLYKHNATRQKLREQEIAKLQAAAAEAEEKEKEKSAKKKAAKGGKGKKKEEGRGEDLVEDFVLSDDEGEAYDMGSGSEDEEGSEDGDEMEEDN